ncbi:Hypothetical Protein NTJ_06246 [Nesidiocoris tenuis]|uniref:Integrase catalytic domain-containing protein n=1 Tax=Nesidiocoris tenuis TaxID=355587 RepID=A0ABN7AR88_9HEMI|nr:Hypothetical Protein NTJ_06246 [Nesidiocoris tenuis]
MNQSSFKRCFPKKYIHPTDLKLRSYTELSTLAHPLYQLLRKDANFNFDEKCRNSFNLIKQAMASERVLTHFDPKKLLVLSTDASPFGFGAVLSHRLKNGEERPIAFGSRTLNSAEVKYSQIEKEAAAIIYGVKKFFSYLWQTPASPMERIHVDYAGPFKNHYFLIIVDAYSRWVDVHPVRNMTSATTIELLKRFFTDFGLPHVIVSDNGTQFKSSEFRNFCESLGIIQKLTAPYHPATNGLAERGVQSLKASIRSSVNEGSNVQDAVLKFLTSYRRSPHSVTGKSPASLFLGRAFRSKIDLVRPQHSSVSLTKEDVRRPREFSEGTKVAFRCYNDPASKWKIGIVMARKGDLHYEIKCDNITFFRHVDQIRQAGEHLENSSGLPDLPFPAPITDIDQPQPDPIPMMPDQEEEQPRNPSEGPKSPEFTFSSPPRRTSMQAENSTTTPRTEIQTSTRRGRIIRKPVKLDL